MKNDPVLFSSNYCHCEGAGYAEVSSAPILNFPNLYMQTDVLSNGHNSCIGSVLERLRGTRAIPRPTARAFPAKFPKDFRDMSYF